MEMEEREREGREERLRAERCHTQTEREGGRQGWREAEKRMRGVWDAAYPPL